MADFACFAKTATPRHVRHDDVGGVLFDHLAEAKLGDEALADTEWNGGVMFEASIGFHIVGRDDLFKPHQVIGFEGMGNLGRFGQIPAGMAFDADFDLVAYRLTNVLDIRDTLLEVFTLEMITDRPYCSGTG